MQKSSLLAGLLAVAASLFLVPREAAADPEHDRCIDEARNGSEFRACGFAWIDREDARLNAAWRELLPRFEGRDSERAALVAEQRAWIAFKDQSCDFFWSESWGMIGRDTWYAHCRAGVIATRTAQLRALVEQLADE